MFRGEVWWVAFTSTIGGEIQKIRPAVIVSNDSNNLHSNRVQVIPITSNATRLYPSEAHTSVDGKQCKAMADQIMTVSKQRLRNRLGAVSEGELSNLDRAIRIQLGLG